MQKYQNENNKGNKMRSAVVCIFLCLMICACGQNSMPEKNTAFAEDSKEAGIQKTDAAMVMDSGKEKPDKEEQALQEKQQVSEKRIEVIPADKASIVKRDDEGGREITAEEMQYFTEFVQKRGNFGFLLSVYDTPADVDLDQVCFNGLGESSLSEISEEEREAYKKTVAWGEIYTDFFRITSAQLDEYLLETTGLSYEQMNHSLGWTYLPEYDAYYSDHGDTNYRAFICKGGYTVDEKLFVLRMASDDFGVTDGYHTIDYELVLEKCGDTYQFRSNRFILEDGLIKDQSFDVNLSPVGDVTFVSYEPDLEAGPLADVSFFIIRDGQEPIQLAGVFADDNIRAVEKFQGIEAVAFADYDEDGVTDIIVIINYSLASGADTEETYSELRIYKGEYEQYSYGDYYYQRYQGELSETLTAKLPELTIRGVLDYLAKTS